MWKINKNLLILLSGQLVSQVGDGFYNIAIAFWVLKTTNSPAMMGVILFAQMMSSVVTGLFAGSIVDSINRQYIIVAADIIRGIIISLLVVIFYLNIFNLAFIIIVEILLGINAAFFNTSVPAILPQIVEGDELLRANSKCQFISGSAMIFGPILGGIAIASFGYGFAFIVNAASFLISGVFELFIQLPYVLEKSTGVQEGIKRKLIAGYKYIYKSRQITVILIVVAIIHLFYGSILVIMPVLANTLSGKSAELLGYFQASFGVGSVIVALILCIVKVDKNEDKLLFLGIAGIGLMFCVIALVGFFETHLIVILLMVLFAALSGVIAVTGLSFRVLIQKNVENNMIGRVFGVVTTIGSSSIPVAMLIYGFLLNYYNSYLILLVSGCLMLISSLVLSRYYFSKMNYIVSEKVTGVYDV